MSPRTTSLLVVLIIATLGSWYLALDNKPADVDTVPFDPGHSGYYLKTARILGTGSDGSLLYEIEAAHAEQMAKDRIEFTDVRIRYSPEADVPWVVHADEATIREGSPRIALRGHVRAVSTRDSNDEDTEIRTQYLELDPDRYVAETDERVQIRIGALGSKLCGPVCHRPGPEGFVVVPEK